MRNTITTFSVAATAKHTTGRLGRIRRWSHIYKKRGTRRQPLCLWLSATLHENVGHATVFRMQLTTHQGTQLRLRRRFQLKIVRPPEHWITGWKSFTCRETGRSKNQWWMVPTLFAACCPRGRPRFNQHREESETSLAGVVETVRESRRRTRCNRKADAKRQESGSYGFKCGCPLGLSRPRCQPR